jgi:prepilin-type N-terminal cleavage/methylation domain
MCKSNKKNGFNLIEVMCSVTLFSILFMITLTIGVKVLKIKKYNKEINNYSLAMEEIKNRMIYNSTYNELQQLKLENRYYISEENINFDKLRQKDLIDMFIETKPLQESYLVISIEEGMVLKVNLKLYAKVNNDINIMECEFYKGEYKR